MLIPIFSTLKRSPGGLVAPTVSMNSPGIGAPQLNTAVALLAASVAVGSLGLGTAQFNQASALLASSVAVSSPGIATPQVNPTSGTLRAASLAVGRPVIGAAQLNQPAIPLFGAALTVGSPGFTAALINPPVGAHPFKIGGGGLIIGLDIAPDGTRVCRTDTYGAYLFNPTAPNSGNAGGLTGEWQQICTVDSMPAALVLAANGSPLDSPTANSGKGAYEIAIDPSNPSIFWMVFYGHVLRSTNKGATWSVITGFVQDINAESNTGSGARQIGSHIAIDPQNSNIVNVGVTTGLFVTVNGTAAAGAVVFNRVTQVLAPGANSSGDSGGVIVTYDPNSPVNGGKKQGIYASSYGIGVYRSIDGGANWVLTTGSPKNHFNMRCAGNGTLYWVDDTGISQVVHRYTGTWAAISTPGSGGNLAADIDPATGHVFVLDTDGNLAISTNNGASFVGPTSHTIVAADIPWHAQNPVASMYGTAIRFDPSRSNVLVQAYGFGIAWCNPPTTAGNVTWNSQSAGIEQVVVNRIISPPGGYPVIACWDRVGFTSLDATKYPSQQNCFYTSTQLSHGWSVDWASASHATVVSYSDIDFGNDDGSGVSQDKGVTWAAFGSISYNGGEAGCIAASTASLFVLQSGNNTPQYTRNGGANWAVCPGLPGNGAYQTGVTSLWPQIVATDRVDPNTFYVFTGDIYKSTTNPPSFTKVFTGLDTYGFAIPLLEAVPNLGTISTAGHLFQSLGKEAGTPFHRSITHGATWTDVPNVTEVWAFGFGAPAPGHSYPAIYIIGFVSGVWGWWQSIDNAVSWTKLTDYPLRSFDTPTTCCGDSNVFGLAYVGFQGSGAAAFR